MKSSVFGFPDFQHLVELQDNGILRWYGGMTSKEPGAWCVIRGDPNEGERSEDLFVELTQPLPDSYREAFVVTGKSCFWRGKLTMPGRARRAQKVRVDGGIVVSEVEEGAKLVREGVFTATEVDEDGIDAQRKKAREALERALMTPKAETTGFKTAARIAGIRKGPKRKLLAGDDKEDPQKLLTDD